MIISIIGIMIGVSILGAGLYFLFKEKNDPESRKICSIIAVAGGILLLAMILKLVFLG